MTTPPGPTVTVNDEAEYAVLRDAVRGYNDDARSPVHDAQWALARLRELYPGTPLQAASHRGHKEVVEMLLGMVANVNAQGGYYGTALQAASDGGHKEVVEILLGNGADVHAQGGVYGTAL